MVRTIEIQSLSNFKVHNAVLLTIIMVLWVRSPGLIYILGASLCPWTTRAQLSKVATRDPHPLLGCSASLETRLSLVLPRWNRLLPPPPRSWLPGLLVSFFFSLPALFIKRGQGGFGSPALHLVGVKRRCRARHSALPVGVLTPGEPQPWGPGGPAGYMWRGQLCTALTEAGLGGLCEG